MPTSGPRAATLRPSSAQVWSRRGRWLAVLLLAAFTASLGVMPAAEQPAATKLEPAEPPAGDPAIAKPSEGAKTDRGTAAAAERQWREGSEINDVPGTFRVHNGRVVFVPADGRKQLVALENLNLERVARVLADQTEPLQWVVSGVITEYRGINFLLMRRVVLKNRSLDVPVLSKGS